MQIFIMFWLKGINEIIIDCIMLNADIDITIDDTSIEQ
jgi:hypothetical protein